MIGQLLTESLGKPLSNYGYDANYRLNLGLDAETAVTLRTTILENRPFKDEPDFHPLISQSATFSTKVKTLRKSEAPNMSDDDPFPYLFNK